MTVEDIFRTMIHGDQVVIDTPANYDNGKSVIYKGSSINIPVKLFNRPIYAIYAIDDIIHVLIGGN